MKYRIRLCDEDRERYGGPEVLEYDRAWLDDIPADELERIEAELLPHRVTLVQASAEWEYNLTARACRVVFWLAYRQAGITLPYKDFTPKVMAARAVDLELPDGGDADPPAPTEEESSPTSSPGPSTEPPGSAPSPSS